MLRWIRDAVVLVAVGLGSLAAGIVIGTVVLVAAAWAAR